MTDDTTYTMIDDDPSLFEEDCGYDPLAVEEEEKDADEKAETFGYIGTPDEASAPSAQDAPQVPARERIERLFSDMPPYKGWFLAIMEACRDAQTAQQVDAVIESMRSKRRSVFETASLCAMLQAAGALVKLSEDGTPYEEIEPQLVEVEENGRTYLRPTTPPQAYWRATPEAIEVLADYDPLADLLAIVEDQAAYTDVFREILGMCEGDGSSINQIKDQVNANPALEYPKKTAQFFMDYLERHEAIAWDGAWKTTEVGRELLGQLEGR